ncbi:MAG: LacI family DNA-binding transcriptional regulator [Microbacterium sp.]
MARRSGNAKLADVARLADVSPGLVSRILNEDPTLKIREDTRERVRAAVERLEYAPHASARALRSARTGMLGFALYHVNDPIYAQMVETAQSAAAERGYLIVLLNAEELLARVDSLREVIRGHRVDGLLIQGGFSADNRALGELARAVPSLMFNASATSGIRSVRVRDEGAAALATRHLIDLGHERIVFVGASGDSSERRLLACRETLEEHGLTPKDMIDGTWSAGGAREATERYLAEGGSATGFVVASPTTAMGVQAGALAAGRSVPDDLSVVAVHDAWYAPHLNPSLTVVALPLAGVGRVAVEALIEQIAAQSSGETVLDDPPPELIVRGSTGPPPG